MQFKRKIESGSLNSTKTSIRKSSILHYKLLFLKGMACVPLLKKIKIVKPVNVNGDLLNGLRHEGRGLRAARLRGGWQCLCRGTCSLRIHTNQKPKAAQHNNNTITVIMD